MVFSILTVTDELNRTARKCRINTHLGMTYLSFLEALCRVAASPGCPPCLPLSVVEADAAAAATALLRRKPVSAASGGTRATAKKRAGRTSRGDATASRATSAATRERSPSAVSKARGMSTHAPAPVHPVAPADLPSRLELLLVHVGVAEGYNIANCRRVIPLAAQAVDSEPSGV
jgi:hypothetical protein